MTLADRTRPFASQRSYSVRFQAAAGHGRRVRSRSLTRAHARRIKIAKAKGRLAAVVITLVEGTPQRLPAVALGSNVLLPALRAGAVFAIGLAAATVVARAARGELPAQLSTVGLAYDPAHLRRA